MVPASEGTDTGAQSSARIPDGRAPSRDHEPSRHVPQDAIATSLAGDRREESLRSNRFTKYEIDIRTNVGSGIPPRHDPDA